jgi:phosphodiesterase/alkaline phosphatase D-like protein
MWTKREIAEAVRYEGGITRRLMLAQAASLAALPWLGTRAEGAVKHRPRLADNPFTVGVASGDPGPDGMVLWTRLAPPSPGTVRRYGPRAGRGPLGTGRG